MPPESTPSKLTITFSIVIGIVISSVAALLSIAVAPMLFFARDSRDMTGGIAGAILMAVMLMTGIVLVLRQNSPPPLLRAFYCIIGGLSVVSGAGVLAWGVYSILTDRPINMRAFTMPILFLTFGAEWIRRGVNVGSSSPPPAEAKTPYSDQNAAA